MDVQEIPTKEIYTDVDFNCREQFSPMECTELARDIKRRGLIQPVTIRPLRPESKLGVSDEQNLIRQGYKYKMIAGHRRHMAYVINDAETIPCFVKEAYMSDFDCKDLNATENLQRKELTLWEECRAIEHYWLAGWPRQETAERIQKSPGWVQTRYQLLEMPKEVQELAANGHILTSQLRELNKYKDSPRELLQAAAKLRDHNARGEKGAINVIKRKDTPSTKKQRTSAEMTELLNHIQDNFAQAPSEREVLVGDFVTVQGNSLATRVLAWAAGTISTGEVYQSISEFAEVIGIDYKAPELRDENGEILRI